MKLWGERLKMLRLEHGMTQQALADKLCTERTTIAGRDAFLEKSQEMSNPND